MSCKTIYIPTTASKGLIFLFGPGFVSITPWSSKKILKKNGKNSSKSTFNQYWVTNFCSF